MKNVTIAFRTTEDLKHRLEWVAARYKVSVSWVIREAIIKYLESED